MALLWHHFASELEVKTEAQLVVVSSLSYAMPNEAKFRNVLMSCAVPAGCSKATKTE